MTTTATLTRNDYGEIISLDTESDLFSQAELLVKQAAKRKKIPVAYDDMKWERISSRVGNMRMGTALHHEIYDIRPDGKAVLVCCRATEGTEYGIKTVSKTYYLISCYGKGVRVVEGRKAVAAKAAKAAGNLLGYAIEVVCGKSKLKLASQAKRIGYKALTVDADSNLVSVWDGSPWPLGKMRTERATDDHTGGFYYYRTMDEVLQAAREGEVFGDCREHRELVIARVEISGREVDLYDGKVCASRIKPIEIIASVF